MPWQIKEGNLELAHLFTGIIIMNYNDIRSKLWKMLGLIGNETKTQGFVSGL